MTQETIETPDAPEAPAPPAALVSPEVPRLGVPFGASRSIPGEGRPSFVFLVLVSIVSLVSDIATKLWAEKNLDGYPGIVNVWENHVAFVLAKNRGGAWGLLQGTSENVRRPFFLLVSAAAIAFIVTLYRRLQPTQRALKWGLPLVLGGALGNVFDRIRYGHVIDFIDVHVAWRESEHRWWWPTSNAQFPLIEHHWPTFNVADVAICVGVGLMAIDMFTSKKPMAAAPPAIVPEPGKVPEVDKAPEPEIAPEVVSSGAPTPETKSAD